MPLTTISGTIQAQPLNDNFSFLNQEVTAISTQLFDNRYLGIASLYGVNPVTSDSTSLLNVYFDALETDGLKYAFFDKPATYTPLTAIPDANKVMLTGNAEFNIPYTVDMRENYYFNISDAHRQYNGSINSCNDINNSFKQINAALSENRNVNITIWGDSISYNNGGDILSSNQTLSQGTEATASGLTNGDGYFHRLIDMFTDKFPNNTFNFYNRAIGGEVFVNWTSSVTFNSITQSWRAHILDTAPDLLIIAFGINDNYATSKQTSFITSQLKSYISANFTIIPDIAFITPPRPVNEVSDPSFGTFEVQNSKQIAASSFRTYGRNQGYYVIDVNKISNIKRSGTDYQKPKFKEISLTSNAGFTTLIGGSSSGSTYTLSDTGHQLVINLTAKDFTLIFSATFTLPANDSSLSINYNRAINLTNSDNSFVIFPNNAGDGIVQSYTKSADTNWGVVPVTHTSTGVPFTTMSIRVEKRDDVVEIFNGDTKLTRDIVHVWNTPGYIVIYLNEGTTINFTTSIQNIKYYNETYTTYTPTLTDPEMFGTYAAGDFTTKSPYGGNGVNHPSTIGIMETYVPALEEFMNDISKVVNSVRVGVLQDTVDVSLTNYSATFSFANIGSSSLYPYTKGILKDDAGTRYTLNSSINGISARTSVLTAQFGAYFSLGVLQILLNTQSTATWTFSTYTNT